MSALVCLLLAAGAVIGTLAVLLRHELQGRKLALQRADTAEAFAHACGARLEALAEVQRAFAISERVRIDLGKQLSQAVHDRYEAHCARLRAEAMYGREHDTRLQLQATVVSLMDRLREETDSADWWKEER